MTTFQGTWPALITPFDAHNRVNTAALQGLVEHLVARQVDGLYVCGSTGEGVSMAVDERQHVAETVLAQVGGRVPVIVHIGALALADALELTRHAVAQGAAAVSSIIPPRYATLESVVRYYQAIVTEAPDTHVLPYLLNPQIDTLSLMRALLPHPTIMGTKYTGADVNLLRQIILLGDGREWTVFSGMDEHAAYGVMAGSSGHIGSTLNLMPGAYRQIRSLILAGRCADAQRLQERVNAITNLIYSTGRFFAGLKSAMARLGLDCGDPRLPELPLSREQRDELCARLDVTDFAELAAL